MLKTKKVFPPLALTASALAIHDSRVNNRHHEKQGSQIQNTENHIGEISLFLDKPMTFINKKAEQDLLSNGKIVVLVGAG